jgi:hypothetical protein
MRLGTGFFLVAILGLVACGGGGGDIDDDSQVASLSDEETRELCTEFYDAVCAGLPDIDACLEGCADLCSKAEMPDTMRSECAAPITVGAVRECADAVRTQGEGAYEICAGGGMGGCVFDVADLLCP